MIHDFQVIEKDGVGIHIHFIENGYVYYQKWGKGVEHQGVFDNLFRTPIDVFNIQLDSELSSGCCLHDSV